VKLTFAELRALVQLKWDIESGELQGALERLFSMKDVMDRAVRIANIRHAK
jgi:hypothetical protein